MAELDKATQTELEAAAFRTLVKHLQDHPLEVNIDLMNLADFCRTARRNGTGPQQRKRPLDLDYDEAREIVYGMSIVSGRPSTRPATLEQLAKMAGEGGH